MPEEHMKAPNMQQNGIENFISSALKVQPDLRPCMFKIKAMGPRRVLLFTFQEKVEKQYQSWAF
jgi:hypothetical protein